MNKTLSPARQPARPGLDCVITAVHNLIYTDDEAATRAFPRDVLGFPHRRPRRVAHFQRPDPRSSGVHPTAPGPTRDSGTTGQQHEISFMCDDVEKTMAELAAEGMEFTRGIRDDGYGLSGGAQSAFEREAGQCH
ncbi:MAG: extradiol dioxygenase [Pseudonocardiales bacterium]|nr:MAG: extradiol dioxygenase [Pseudonocardiales bacterium]